MGQCWQGFDLSWPGILGTILIVISAIMYSIAFGTDRWAVGDSLEANPLYAEVQLGITQWCKNDARCERYLDDSWNNIAIDLALVTKTRAIIAMISMCLILSLISIVHIGYAIGRKGKSSLIHFVAIEMFTSAILGAIGCFVWIDITRGLNDARLIQDEFDFSVGGSFVTEVFAWILNLVAGVLFLTESRSIVYASLQDVTRGGAGML